jgi:hypothetical protein
LLPAYNHRKKHELRRVRAALEGNGNLLSSEEYHIAHVCCCILGVNRDEKLVEIGAAAVNAGRGDP